MTSVRALVSRAILRARGIPLLDDELNSEKLRRRYAEHHGITVGLYSYGCFSAARINPNTTIGRYCSFANTVNVFNRNHGTQFLSTTAYLYNARLGVVEKDTIAYESCDIGDDVWVGHNAIILPKARKIGRGAVIAAGAVVTRDVPPYAIVAGNPAKVVGYRFEPEVIEQIEATQWWTWTPDRIRAELSARPELFFQPHLALAQGALDK